MTQWYAPKSGGIRTYLHAKAEYAEARRLRHALVVPGATATVARIARTPVVVVPGLPTAQETGYRLIPHPRPMIQALDRLQPTVLVIHDATSFPRRLCRWAHTRGIPVVSIVHSELEAGAAGMPTALRLPTQHLLRILQSRGLDGPDAVIATSQAVAARLRERSDAHIYVSPLGVDTKVFCPRALDADYRRQLAEPNETLLVHAGRLSSEKRPTLLLDVLAGLQGDTVLVVAGAGSAELDMRRRAAELGVTKRVRFLGHLESRDDLARLYANADCFVHVNSGETFGLAPLEAAACGCRVVVPADCGVAEVVSLDGFHAVQPNSVAALITGVSYALTQPAPLPELDQLSWSRTFDREWALYGLLAGRAAEGQHVA